MVWSTIPHVFAADNNHIAAAAVMYYAEDSLAFHAEVADLLYFKQS